MIWVDDILVTYSKAINALNYDKLGHETGLGSWGVLVEIEDSFEKPLSLYLGIKFDVLSVITNRYITSFVNIPKALKELVPKTKKDSQIDTEINGVSSFVPDIDSSSVIEFFVDIHKVSIDVVEFMNTVYQYVDTTEEYGALVRDTVFMSGGRRASRGISASMLRIYDGNLENFGFIFTRGKTEFLLNEMIIEDSLIHDEIKYTFWLTPHDREEYKFFKNDGDIPAENGSDYITGLGNEKSLGTETEKLYQYDRRGLRAGYYDVTVRNPMINAGYFDGNIEASDTFQFAKDTPSRFHKHKSQISLDAKYQQHISPMIATLINERIGDERMGVAKTKINYLIKITYINIFNDRNTGSFIDMFNANMTNGGIANLIEGLVDNTPVSSTAHAIELSKGTCVSPIVMMNKLRDLRAINVEEIEDCVVFIYHPIVDKFVFYEMGQNDPAEITQNSILFYSDGTQYGIDLRPSCPVFVWSNIQKRFREDISSWINLKGDKYSIGDSPDTVLNPIEDILNKTNSEIPVYDDLTFQGNCAKIIAINKSDLRDIVEKTKGVIDGEYIFGIKTGDIEVIRNGLWM